MTELNAQQVQELQIGDQVYLCGEDAAGQPCRVLCTVARRGGKKYLTYRQNGQIRRCAIKDYEGKTYEKGRG